MGVRRRRRECLWGDFGLVLEDALEGVDEEPGRREDIGAALALEEESEPEGDGGAVRRAERGCWALGGVSIRCRCMYPYASVPLLLLSLFCFFSYLILSFLLLAYSLMREVE